MNINFDIIKKISPESFEKWKVYFLNYRFPVNKKDVKPYYSEISNNFKFEVGNRLFNIPIEMLYPLLEKFFMNNKIIFGYEYYKSSNYTGYRFQLYIIDEKRSLWSKLYNDIDDCKKNQIIKAFETLESQCK
jgi:hypothetical protein